MRSPCWDIHPDTVQESAEAWKLEEKKKETLFSKNKGKKKTV
jgi:hypothetical protein